MKIVLISEQDQSVSSSVSDTQKAERKLYQSACEILTSERTYVDGLKLINIDFKNFIENKVRDTGENIIPLQDFSVIFKNFPQMLDLNENLLRDFEDRIENWDSKKKIADVFVKKGPFLKLFTTYIKDFQDLSEHFENCCQRNPKFKKATQEFECLPKCKNLKILHYLLQPIQRLPRYRLLLEEYFKHLPEDSEDYDDTTDALKIVTDAASHANSAMQKGVN